MKQVKSKTDRMADETPGHSLRTTCCH